MIENSKDLNEYNFSCLGIENRNLEALLYGNISHLMINWLSRVYLAHKAYIFHCCYLFSWNVRMIEIAS